MDRSWPMNLTTYKFTVENVKSLVEKDGRYTAETGGISAFLLKDFAVPLIHSLSLANKIAYTCF